MSQQTISVQQLNERVESGENVELIDVRTPIEFREVHVPFAKNIPLDQLDAAKLISGRNGDDKPLYVICRSGSRGQQARDRIAAAGYSAVINVDGGTQAWDSDGLPVVRGKKAISLERQVRIAAGSLVLVGSVLSLLYPYFIGLAAFVGAGLVFAGVTDTCGMGMMLAKMPWNRVSESESSGSGETCDTSSKSCCG